MFKVRTAAMFLTVCLAAALTIAAHSGAQAPAAAPSAKVHAGEELFNQKCMQCHAVHDGQYSFGPNLEGELKKKGHRTPAEIRTIIKEGKNKMPPFGDKLAPAEIDDLIAYLHTL